MLSTTSFFASTVGVFHEEDSKHKNLLEQAVSIIREAEMNYVRVTDIRNRKIEDLLQSFDSLSKEHGKLSDENSKLIIEIGSLKDILESYRMKEDQMNRRENDLKKQEERYNDRLRDLELEKKQIRKELDDAKLLFSRERDEWSRQLERTETELRDATITIDILKRKIQELENREHDFERTRQELEDLLKSKTLENRTLQEQIENLMEEKIQYSEINKSYQEKMQSYEIQLANIRSDITLEFSIKFNDLKQKEGVYNQKLNDLNDEIITLQSSSQQMRERYQNAEASIHELIRFLYAVKRGRNQLFEDIEYHIAAWKIFFDSNVESVKKQCLTVLQSNSDMWVRKDSKLMPFVHQLMNELNNMTVAKYPYPLFNTEVPRDIDVDILLTNMYMPVPVQQADQSVQPPQPRPPGTGGPPGNRQSSEKPVPYPFAYYTPQAKSGGRKSRPSSAGTARASERSKGTGGNNNNKSDFVSQMRSSANNSRYL